MTCTCGYHCPDCPTSWPVPSLCHGHRIKVHGAACDAGDDG